MKTVISKLIFLFLLFLGGITNVMSQDRNNEDEVIKLNPQMSRFQSVPNELLVKFKDAATVQMSKTGPSRIVSGISEVDRVLGQYDLEEVEQLLPYDQPNRTMRSVKAYSGEIITERSLNKLYRLKVKAESAKTNYQLIAELLAVAEVEFAEPNYIVSVLGKAEGKAFNAPDKNTKVKHNTNYDYTTEPMYSFQWGIPAIKLDALWQKPVINPKRPVIAIIDTGVDTEHPDLKDNLWVNPGEADKTEGYDDDGNGFADDIHGWDFINHTALIKDFNSHGTHCAGIAAAVSDNSVGIAGANPNALIMAVSVMQSNGQGDIATLIKGINYAMSNGADVISLSIGTYAYSIALEQALSQAYQTSVLVAAAGNDGAEIDKRCNPFSPGPMFPAAFTFVMGVEGNQQVPGLCGYRACWSNFDCDGPVFSQFGEEQLYNYELQAPGVSIISTVPGGQYRSYNGTSMAAPLVAGAITALKQRKEFINQEMLWSTLIQSAGTHVDFDAAYDYTPQPELNIVSVEVNDTLSGDKDYRADAGEYLEIYSTIRNTGGNVDSIFFKLEFDEFEDHGTVEILTDSAAFGYALSAYSKMKSSHPFRIRINQNVVDGRNIKMVLKAWHGKGVGVVSQKLLLNVENGVELNGMLTQNTTLYPDKHYLVTSNLGIPAGVTLTIKPGTVLKFKDNVKMSCGGKIEAIGKPDSMIVFTKTDLGIGWGGMLMSPIDVFKYVRIEYINQNVFQLSLAYNNIGGTNISNSIIENCTNMDIMADLAPVYKSNYYNNFNYGGVRFLKEDYYGINDSSFSYNNIINFTVGYDALIQAQGLPFKSNIFSNKSGAGNYSVWMYSSSPMIFYSRFQNYYGSSLDRIVKKTILDFNTPGYNSFAVYDLSNTARQPYAEAHGIVWKVVVNGYDAQDEFDLLPALGVGKQKFEVYFNRPMNKTVIPMIAMGVRPPYTQNAINEDGSWNEAGNIYTAYLSIKGSGAGDGLNRIYVANARDKEDFEIPFENQRFNVVVQAAGSMSNGFEATPGLGKVTLLWEKPEGYFDDLLGYNMYRFTYNSEGISSDTTLVNSALITDTVYTDFNVVPGKTYNYMYKVMRTNLTENDFSKVVSTTPFTASKGDANGDLAVNVLDITSIVAYLLNNNPHPFISEAADMNSDGNINVLDIVGVVNKILNIPQGAPRISMNQQVDLYLQNDTLFADATGPIGGIQLDLSGVSSIDDIQVLQPLQGFESGYGVTAGGLRLLYYSMSGKSIPGGNRIPLLKMKAGSTIADAIFSETNGSPIKVNYILTRIGNISNNMNQTVAESGQNYPNPVNGKTIIPVRIYQPVDEAVLRIVNMVGQQVDMIRLTNPYIGEHLLSWNPAQNKGLFVYVLEIRNGNKKMVCPVRKMIVQ